MARIIEFTGLRTDRTTDEEKAIRILLEELKEIEGNWNQNIEEYNELVRQASKNGCGSERECLDKLKQTITSVHGPMKVIEGGNSMKTKKDVLRQMDEALEKMK